MRIEAERLVIEMPEARTQTIARRLSREFGATLESARAVVRSARGEHKKETRNLAAAKRPKAKRGKGPKMPPSQAEPWKPFKISEKKIASLSDIHIPYHDAKALGAAVEHVKKFKPDTLLLNGDFCDFYTISRWVKDPRKRNFAKEKKACIQALEWIRSELGKKCRIVFKKGNHEERWDHWLWNHAPEISDAAEMLLENWLEFDKHGIEMVENQRPILCGKLPVFHGHELPKGLTNPVNMARGAFLRLCDTVLVGHGHRSSSHTEPNWKHEEITCWSQGCLCDMNPEYARVNKWNHGFALIEVASRGEFNLTNLRINKEGKVRKS